MYYELMLLQSMQNEGWGKSITSQFWKYDFYLRHRSTRGNVRWFSKWLFVYWFTLSTVSGIMAYYRLMNDVGLIVDVCFYFLQMALLLWPLVCIAYLWKKMPAQIGDHMMLEEEFNMTCYVLALSVLGYVVVAVLMALGQNLGVHAGVGVAWIFTAAAPSLVATVWIPGRLTQRMLDADASSSSLSQIVLTKGLFKDRRTAADGSRVVSVLDELAIIYSDEAKMKALGSWMMKRFATESFLCFVEMVQFKERVIALVKEQNPKFSDKSVVRHRHCLYNHCPKSSIVFNLSADTKKQFLSEMEITKQIDEETVRSESGWVRSERVDSGRTFWIHTESNEVRFTEPLSCEEKTANSDQGMNCGDISTDVDRIIFELEEEKRIYLSSNHLSALRRSAHLIFEKYVDNRAALAINIGYGLREHHIRLHQYHFVSLSTMQWISLYDDILAVLQNYIVQSYLAMIRQLRDAEKSD